MRTIAGGGDWLIASLTFAMHCLSIAITITMALTVVIEQGWWNSIYPMSVCKCTIN